jgi:saccharopine dehydrogenase-like NADP-dependent oxidoreductase
MKEMDVVVNCAPPYHYLQIKVAKAAIEAGKNYVDFSEDSRLAQEMLALNSLAKQKDITVVMGLGAGSQSGSF